MTNLNGANDDISDTGVNANTDAEDIADGSDVNANLVVGTVITNISSDIQNLGEADRVQKDDGLIC